MISCFRLLSFRALPFAAALTAFCSVPSYGDIYFEFDRIGNTKVTVTGTPGDLSRITVNCQAQFCSGSDVAPQGTYGSYFVEVGFTALPDSLYGAQLRADPNGLDEFQAATILFSTEQVPSFGGCPLDALGCTPMIGQEELAGVISWLGPGSTSEAKDRIYVQAVDAIAPEPSSILLLLTMLGGVGFACKQRIRFFKKPSVR